MRQQTAPWLLVRVFFGLLALCAAVSAQTAEVHLRNNLLIDDPNAPAIQGRLPVLFVHGHNDDDDDSDFNYQKNWQDSLRGLPSFKQTLELDENSLLGIEPYFIRFEDQNRSITEDAVEISDAVERILHRHDPNYPGQPTNVQVVIIAYSKGTISTRLYLKSLQTQVSGMPPPRPDFRPVSEFIAIAPPNHGINTRLFGLTSSLAIKQLYNGVRPSGFFCGDSFNEPAATNYIGELNGHPITDTLSVPLGSDDREALGSRANGDPPTTGTLYVTLFDDLDRDFVGGDVPSADCVGRAVAVNLAPNAQNIPIAGITDDGWDTIPPLGILTEAERKAIAVHQNTVHTPEIICQALYAAVHHQRMPVGQSCTLVDGKPVIPPPARAAAVLTLDFSGSMQAVACPGCPNRAVVLKDAVVLFTQLWSAVSVPSDRIGLTYFASNVTSFPATGDPLPLLSDAADDVITDVNAQSPGGSTAMGGGLQRAINTLGGVSADTPIRRVILFTDGMQNVNPMVQNVGGQLVIDNQSGLPNSNVSPSTPPIVLNPPLGIAVDTIGIGTGQTFVDLLQDIASATNGRTWLTTTPDDDLRRFFVEELINTLKGFSPQLVAYRRGTLAANGSRETFTIEGGVRKLVLKASWKRGASMNFSVFKNGVDVTSSGRFLTGDFYKIFVIDFPSKRAGSSRGNWQVRINGKATTPYEAAAIVDGSRITYDAIFETKPRVGGPLDLVVRITDGKRPISARAKACVDLMSPKSPAKNILSTISIKDVSSFEPGMTLADRQQLAVAQDPKKWAALKPARQRLTLRRNERSEFRIRVRPRVPGIYTAFVNIEGDDAKVGQFTRTLTVITVVRSR